VSRPINLGDLSHLCPEDAELYAALYRERNGASRGEVVRVHLAAEQARRDASERAWRAAWDVWETGGPPPPPPLCTDVDEAPSGDEC
jgi:hypothetical protein